jgi:hypothetical protein
MSISVKQFQDALASIAHEHNWTCESSDQRAAVGDIVNGVAITNSKCVHLSVFKRDYLAQAFRTLLNMIGQEQGRVVNCLPVKPKWAAASANFRDDRTGVMFEIYESEQAGERVLSIAAAWGAL